MCASESVWNKPRTRDMFVKRCPVKLKQWFFKTYSRFCCVIDDQTLLAGMATWLSLLMYYVLLWIRNALVWQKCFGKQELEFLAEMLE